MGGEKAAWSLQFLELKGGGREQQEKRLEGWMETFGQDQALSISPSGAGSVVRFEF